MSKSAKGIIAIIIILLVICILVYPALSDEVSDNEGSKEYEVTFINGNAEYFRINIDPAHPTIGNNMPSAPSSENGMIFVGWNTKTDGSGNNVTSDTQINKDITVFAVWTIEEENDRTGFTSTSSQSYKIDDKTVEIVLGDLYPIPKVEEVTVIVYDPETGKQCRGSLGGSEYTLSFDNVRVSFQDTDNDGLMDSNEKLTFEADNGLTAGIWNIELDYENYKNGNNQFHFHIFENGEESYPENVRVNFLDVGQADSALMFTSDNKTILIDAGVPLNKKTEYAPKLIEQLKNYHVEKIDAMILTHPDYDHIAGAEAVLDEYDVLSVYMCKKTAKSATYTNLLSAIDQEGCEKHIGDFSAGDYLNLSTTENFRVLSVDSKTKNDTNSASIVIRMSCESHSFLFTGDAPDNVEMEMLQSYSDELDTDILKVGHHGSKSSSSSDFLQAVTPSISVISCGKDNSYGHPHEEALERLNTYSEEVVRIDISGAYSYTSSGKIID
jgi:hypothetical protein